MKKSLLLASAAVFALCFAACQKEENNGLQFTACMEQAVDIQDGKTVAKGGLIVWEQGDQVQITGAGWNSRTYAATPREDDSTWAILTPMGEGAELGDGPYTAIFPSALALEGNSLMMQNTQSSPDGRLSNMFPMYAVSSSTTMQFKNLCGVLKVHLQQSGVNIKKITVEADECLAGRFNIGGSDNAPTLTPNSVVVNNVSLECIQAQNITDGHDFYIFMPANSYHNMTLTFYKADNSHCTKACGQTVVIERSKISTATLTNSLEFVGGDVTGRLSGLFSVGNGHRVYFSQGNLQWTSAGAHSVNGGDIVSGTWRFAEHQYDVVGSPSQYNGSSTSNPYNVYTGNVSGSDNAYISSSYTGWIDLFGWGTSGYDNKHPYMTSTTNTDYGNGTTDINGTNYDWGVYNAISNGGNTPGQWRTLTYDEWNYLCNSRTDASSKYAIGHIDMGDGTYVNGCIFLPDSWTLPAGCTFTPGCSFSETDYSRNTYTLSQWALMEAAGAIFLPAAGDRSGTGVYYVGTDGYCWSSSNFSIYGASNFFLTGSRVNVSNYGTRCIGRSVRLVQDK